MNEVETLRAELEAAQEIIERQAQALERLRHWADAYPLSVFPEPDFKKARLGLESVGITLDAVSASNMRHVITQAQKIVREGLGQAVEQITAPDPLPHQCPSEQNESAAGGG